MKAHAGNFTQGQTGATYTFTVRNAGSAATVGPVSVTDVLPAGLIATGMAGTGWTCLLGTLTCTRVDALAAGQSYPSITLTVNVAADAASSLTNTASVSGGGDGNGANNSASDLTTISPVALTPDLTIAKSHAGNFTRGQTGATYTLTVRNQGPAATAGSVTVSDVLPTGLTATSLAGPGWTCALNTLTCTRGDVLAAGQSYPAITLTVSVATDAGSAIDNTASVSGGETNTANNSATDRTTIGGINPVPDLVIAKRHAGNLRLGQTGATYTLSVSNAGSAPTVGQVTVTAALPAGLAATDIAGAGWTCVLSTLSCTRGDALAAGSSYPDIVVTVNVAIDAAASLTNSASVSGGGDADGSNNAASDSTTVEAVEAIPVLGPWGLTILTAIMVWVALRRLHRRRPVGP